MIQTEKANQLIIEICSKYVNTIAATSVKQLETVKFNVVGTKNIR